MHLNDVLNEATIVPWVPNSYLLLVLGEMNGGIQQKMVFMYFEYQVW